MLIVLVYSRMWCLMSLKTYIRKLRKQMIWINKNQNEVMPIIKLYLLCLYIQWCDAWFYLRHMYTNLTLTAVLNWVVYTGTNLKKHDLFEPWLYCCLEKQKYQCKCDLSSIQNHWLNIFLLEHAPVFVLKSCFTWFIVLSLKPYVHLLFVCWCYWKWVRHAFLVCLCVCVCVCYFHCHSSVYENFKNCGTV